MSHCQLADPKVGCKNEPTVQVKLVGQGCTLVACQTCAGEWLAHHFEFGRFTKRVEITPLSK